MHCRQNQYHYNSHLANGNIIISRIQSLYICIGEMFFFSCVMYINLCLPPCTPLVSVMFCPVIQDDVPFPSSLIRLPVRVWHSLRGYIIYSDDWTHVHIDVHIMSRLPLENGNPQRIWVIILWLNQCLFHHFINIWRLLVDHNVFFEEHNTIGWLIDCLIDWVMCLLSGISEIHANHQIEIGPCYVARVSMTSQATCDWSLSAFRLSVWSSVNRSRSALNLLFSMPCKHWAAFLIWLMLSIQYALSCLGVSVNRSSMQMKFFSNCLCMMYFESCY